MDQNRLQLSQEKNIVSSIKTRQIEGIFYICHKIFQQPIPHHKSDQQNAAQAIFLKPETVMCSTVKSIECILKEVLEETFKAIDKIYRLQYPSTVAVK